MEVGKIREKCQMTNEFQMPNDKFQETRRNGTAFQESKPSACEKKASGRHGDLETRERWIKRVIKWAAQNKKPGMM
ncbi:hypothetical protein ES705_02078 [subsurface metagenome]